MKNSIIINSILEPDYEAATALLTSRSSATSSQVEKAALGLWPTVLTASPFAYQQIANDSLFWTERQLLIITRLNSSEQVGQIIKRWLASLEEELTAANNEQQAKHLLRLWRNRIMVALVYTAATTHCSIDDEFYFLSMVADRLIKAAYLWLIPRFKEINGAAYSDCGESLDLVIVAMGKYGARELNFSSDIDLIFFYATDGESRGGKRKLEHHTYFIRLGQQLIQLLDERTADGQVFRVDMRLRPYGESGPLAMSLDAAEEYYQEQGREWERFALVKARVLELTEEQNGEDFYSLIAPFVFRRYIDYGVLGAIRDLKQLIDQEVRRKGLETNIKLGSGGIREAEFIVQSLQLIRGGRMPALRVRGLLQALDALANHEMIEHDIAEKLAQYYRFLREVEHRLQMLEDKQTQLLPSDKTNVERIALLMSPLDKQAFFEAVAEARTFIAAEFSRLFETNESVTNQQVSVNVELMTLTDIQEVMPQLTDNEAAKVYKIIANFFSSNSIQRLSKTGRDRVDRIVPVLLPIIAKTDEPSITIERVIELIKSISRRSAYIVLLIENPPVLQQLVDLCAKSSWIAEKLATFPILLDELLYPNQLYAPLDVEELKNELQLQLLRIEYEDVESYQNQLRIFKQCHELRVAAALINRTIDIDKASCYLSYIAEAVLESLAFQVWHNMKQLRNFPNSFKQVNIKDIFSIVAYGKFGGLEMGFGSDLDLVFLYKTPSSQDLTEPFGDEHRQILIRYGQRIVSAISMRTSAGLLYEADMRLRPSGKSGLLVTDIDAFTDYQFSEAWTWEHQALTRARCIFGDNQIDLEFRSIQKKVICQSRDDTQLLTDVVNMREKMRKNLDKSNNDWVDLKQGRGAIVDIEFIAQYLVLQYQPIDSKTNWSTVTTSQLRLLIEHQVLSPEHGKALIEAYNYYRELNNYRVLEGKGKLIARAELEPFIDSVTKIWHLLFSIKEN